MNRMIQEKILDSKNFPLHGKQLIEASAGTGKTYTIAHLYLRFILGHHREALTADQILVVTFTEAATKELRARIRKNIHKARCDFEKNHSNDPFIQSLINYYATEKETAIKRLLAAEQQMDEAAIFTIHGFCQRMLTQHAFESGALFNNEFIENTQPLLQQISQDFWRRHFYTVDINQASLVANCWQTPDHLLKKINPWLGQHTLKIQTPNNQPQSFEAFNRIYIQPILQIKQQWLQNETEIENSIRQAPLKKTCKALKRLTIMTQWIHSHFVSPQIKISNKTENILANFTKEQLTKDTLKNKTPPNHAIFNQISSLLNTSDNLNHSWKNFIYLQAYQQFKHDFNDIKQKKRLISFDDLLINLYLSLQKEGNNALAKAIRIQYPAAMIDEFQDTDSIQYGIMETIYDKADDNSVLLMIGDPKQAIYSFRGANIFTYMHARSTIDSIYTLPTNWRSTDKMIAAVNDLFSMRKQSFFYDHIPFKPVNASPKANLSHLSIKGEKASALQFWLYDQTTSISNADYEQQFAQACAIEINQLLTLAQTNDCTLTDSQSTRALQANDIAILVHTGHQAKVIQKELQHQGIASVYLSNRESVYSCAIAQDIIYLLIACLSPNNARSVRSALATPLFALTAPQLDELNQNETLWEKCIEEFYYYHYLWKTFGIMPMLRHILYHRNIANNLQAKNNGSRQLTDFLHLTELLANASTDLESPNALLRWFIEKCSQPNTNDYEQQLHLESEYNLVKIITIYKAKGLEYNLCFIPFACSFYKSKESIYYDTTTQTKQLDLSNSKNALELADQERLSEELRLLYVAVTRSIHRCVLGIAPLKKGNFGKKDGNHFHLTALGYLFNESQPITIDEIKDKLLALNQNNSSITIDSLPNDPLPKFKDQNSQSSILQAKQFTGKIETNWRVTSYSALSKHRSNSPVIQKPMTADLNQAVANLDEHTIFTFPKGARAGTFLHHLFENLPQPFEEQALSTLINEQLEFNGFEPHWQAVLHQMITHCLNTDLTGDNIKLINIPSDQKKIEMEFYLPLSELSAIQLNQILQTHDPLSKQATPLDFRTIKGMFKGFIDLVFEQHGHWYILDYKSNFLGYTQQDYNQQNMQKTMIDHRYDLQYQLYTLAIHRLLTARLPNYHYDKHFGGVIYLFLRGVTSNSNDKQGIYFTRPKRQLVEALDNLFSGSSHA